MKRLPRLPRAAVLAAALFGLLWVGPLSGQGSDTRSAPDTSSLTQQEKHVLDYLRADWSKQYRTTSILLAAGPTKIKLPDDSRLRLERFLEAHRSDFGAPARHGITTVVLTPEEKLMARALLLREIASGSASVPGDIAADMKLPARRTAQRLDFLSQAGVVVVEGEGKGRRYRVAERYPRRPSPRIDFYSHLVEVNGGDRFEVA
jgi:DNA-binding transcriptional ArsR family regulator